MAKEISLKKNFLMNSLYTALNFLFPLIAFPYISRVLGPEGCGKVSFATSLISYFAMIAQLGIPSYGIRVCAKVRDNREELTRTAHELLMINLIMCVISYIAFFIVLFTVPKLQEDRMLYVMISSTILLGSIGMEWLYQALEQYTYITVRSMIMKAVAMAAMFLLIHREEDYVIYGGISIFASSASNIFNLFNAHKFIGFRSVGGYRLRRHLKPVLIFFAMACATTLYTHLDEVMLGFMTTDTDVGYYNAAVRIKKILVAMITSLGAVLLPRASYYVEQGRMEEFRRLTAKAMRFVFLMAVPLAVYFFMYAKEGIDLISGELFAGSVVPMQILMPTLLLIGMTNVMGIQILVPTGREKTVLYSELTGAGVDIVINALLIPSLRSSGAAIGTLAAEAAVLAVQYFAMRKEAGRLFRGISYGKILAGAAAGVVLSGWILWMDWGAFAKLTLSAILFFGGYAGVLLLTGEELAGEIFRQVKGKLKRSSGS